MTATLHFLWGLSPKCLCTSTKPSPLPQNPFVSLIWLGIFILVCLPSSLPIPVSLVLVCPDSSSSVVLSCLSQTPTTTCAVSHPQLPLLLHDSLWAARKGNFCQAHCPPPPQPKRKEHAQGPGEFPHSQVPSLYPKSDPNPNWGKNSVSISPPTQHPSFHEWKTWKNERVQRGHMILLKDSDDWETNTSWCNTVYMLNKFSYSLTFLLSCL